MKVLNGAELAGFIKERQAKQVRALRQADNVQPKLAIIRTNPDPVVDRYMQLKQSYGDDILVEVNVHTVAQSDALQTIEKLNNDHSVHGIIVQIPLPDPSQTPEVLDAVEPKKDVDGLAKNTDWDAPTPIAINWLLAGYNIDLRGKHLAIVGHGRLVGRPLAQMWESADLHVSIIDKSTPDLAQALVNADIIVSATGVPGLITPDMIKIGAVIIDAGVSTDSNGLVGDVAAGVRERTDITITPEKGGVGPLTVCALFENVIVAARKSIKG